MLTPLAVDPGRPFPHISNLSLSLAILIEDNQGHELFARVKVPNSLPRLVNLNEVHRVYGEQANAGTESSTQRLVWLEKVIEANLDLLFVGMHVKASSIFRVTRNNDIEIAEEEASDLMESIEEVVRQRRFGPVVRLDVADTMPESIRTLLQYHMEIAPEDVYVLSEPLGMKDLAELANLDIPHLKFTPYTPSRPPALAAGNDMFAAIRQGDILLHHPMSPSRPLLNCFSKPQKTHLS